MPEQVTLITGASKGIGRAVAEEMTARGHHVIGIARSKPDGSWFKGTFIELDLADRAAVAKTLPDVVAEHGVTGLVNNAGIAIPGRIEKISLADVDSTMNLNFTSLVQCIQMVLPGMRASKYGRIVNIGSRAGLGRETRSIYGGSKGAVASMTRALALELARDGITVNCVAPGPVDTELFLQNHPHGSPERQKIVGTIPVARIGTPKDIASACAYFLSEDAGYTTGQVLYVCGGLSVGQSPV